MGDTEPPEYENIFQVFIKLHGKSFTLLINEEWDVDTLMREACNKLPEEIRPEELQLICEGKQLQYGARKTLKDYKIGKLSNLYVVFRLPGGYSPRNALKMKKEGLKPLPGFITITTTETCMITLDDDECTKRAKMPCGHVIGCDGMTTYVNSLLSAGFFSFKCPHVDDIGVPDCKRQWEWFMVRHVAAMPSEEKNDFEKRLADNYIQRAMGAQQCPGCHNYCLRNNKADRCVRCIYCTRKDKKGFDFCWSCLSESNGSKCVNSECDGSDRRIKILKECPTAKMGYTKLEVPSIRACPNCSGLYSHDGGCKQMACPTCDCKFCFVCLKKADESGKYTCGKYNEVCKIAPRQTSFVDP